MLIVAVSDLHLDAVTHGVSRFQEVTKAVDQSVQYAIAQRASAYMFLGDLCDPDSGPIVFRCIEVAIRAAVRLHQHLIPSLWLAGNHDVIEAKEAGTTLSPLRSLGLDAVYVLEEPRVFSPKGLFQVCALPFTPSVRPYDPEKAIPDEGVDVCIGHLNIEGLAPGSETTEMPRGREVMFPVDKAVSKSKLVIGGHYHKQQRTPEGVYIVGSSAVLSFGEEFNSPGFLALKV